MGNDKRLKVRQAHTADPDVDHAIAELSAGLDTRGASANLLFCSPNYDLEKLGRKIASVFSGPVISCTTSGESAGRSESGFLIQPA